MNVGEKIKNRRKELGITQVDLADGLCTQAMISRIEKETVVPSTELIQKLSERLHTPMNQLMGKNTEETTRLRAQKLIHLLRKHLERREYDSISYQMDVNKELIHKSTNKERLFFEWVEGLLYYYDGKDRERAIHSIKQLSQTIDKGELYVEILSSIGNLYSVGKEYAEAEEHYHLGFEAFNEWMNHEKKVKLLFNYSICLSKQEKYAESLEKTMQGIDLLVEHNTLYLLGDFYYQKGYSLRRLGELKKSVDAYEKSRFVFDIQQNERYRTMAELAAKEVEEEYNENKNKKLADF